MTDKKLYATKCGTVQSLFVFLFCLGFVLSITLPSFAKQKPRVALVLSGGGARGGAHIGVLRVLEREGIPIDMIVGVSYGALVGGLCAAGYSVDNVERIIVGTDWWEITNNHPNRRLSNLNRKPIADRQMLALRLDNLPVDVALDAGADLVIAVDCATPLRSQKHEFEDIIDVIDQAVSFRIEEKKIANRKLAHVLIMPDLKKFDGGDFNLSYTLIAVGKVRQ